MMKPAKKFYFSRREVAVVQSDNEEEARLELASLYVSSEDFILDDVIDGIEIDGVFIPSRTA